MSNPNIMDNGVLREMTDEEAEAHAAEQFARITAMTMPQALLDYAASVRYAKEVGGTICVVGDENNVPVQTDRGSQATFTSIFMAIKMGLRTDGAQYKFADGKFRKVSNDDMANVCLAVLSHVENVFTIESNIQAEIDARRGTFTNKAAIDGAFAG